MENIEAAKKRQKKNYDKLRKSNARNVKIGETVYVRNFKQTHKTGSIMEPRWIGPYLVSEDLGKGEGHWETKLANFEQHVSHCKPQGVRWWIIQQTGSDFSNVELQPFEDKPSETVQQQALDPFNPVNSADRRKIAANLSLEKNQRVIKKQSRSVKSGSPQILVEFIIFVVITVSFAVCTMFWQDQKGSTYFWETELSHIWNQWKARKLY